MAAHRPIAGYASVYYRGFVACYKPGRLIPDGKGWFTMRGQLWGKIVGAMLIAAMVAGCQSSGSRRSAPEPVLSGTAERNGSVAEAPPPKTITYVDRHPLLSTPREYWESSGDNKIVKTAAATFVGVPVGFYKEIKQIVVGTPPETR